MKDWWNNLVLREKQMVFLGALFIIAALLYLLLWLPLQTKVAELRQDVQINRALLSWMKESDKRIQESSPNKDIRKESGSLLTIVQKQIKVSTVAKSVSQLRQADNESVLLTFKNVEFDKLITWLITFTQDYQLTITQMSVTPTGTRGVVAADVVLSK
jgi:general secretion pathway protein M